MAEAKGVLPSDAVNTLGNTTNKWEKIYAKNIEVDGGLIKTINGVAPDEAGNVEISGANIGDIKWSSVDLTQVGWLVATGAEAGRDTYPDLNKYYAKMGYPWGAGDGSTTFNLPNLIGKFPEGALSAGGYHEAGLPDHEHEVSGTTGRAESGAYGIGGIASMKWTTTTKASLSNPIYGKSNTVQPPSALLIPYVKAFKGASADSTDLEISKVANDVVRLSGRVHLVDSKVNGDGSWYRQYSDGWIEQGLIVNTNANNVVTCNWLKPFANTNYTVNRGSISKAGNAGFGFCRTSIYELTAETVSIWGDIVSQNNGAYNRLYACGMGAKV